MEKLLEKSLKINIIAGSLFYEDDNFYNATYFFSKGKVEIAKKYVLVPFGEEIPFPQFLVDIINEIFYNGAKDYKKAEKPTDFLIKGEKFRNAICYEATSDKIFENLGDTKYMIAISNNAWFTPSIEPTLQKLLLKYYARKYDVIIYHQINGSENYIIRP
jgi:apolipoprotein N-acyltransferase